MALEYTQHYGTVSLEEVTLNNRLIADGENMAIQCQGVGYLIRGFAITELSMTSDRLHTMQLCFTVKSMGRIEAISPRRVEELFVNANKLSVNDLLKFVNQRLDERSEDS